ncbi:MAG: dihydrofolate reductase family protein [Actinomycetota bacterium]|nr:dihydrofolate reductase family protein [Actinomycetota bacterium]
MSDTALRLYPLPVREIPSGAIYEDIELPPLQRRNPARPYVILNAVAAVDGKATIKGKSSGLGSETDRRTMRTLRSKVDAVLVGATTVRAERLSLGLDEFSSGSEPLAVIVTRTGEVPLETNLIGGERQEVLVIIAQDTPEDNINRLGERASVLRVPASPWGGVVLEEALEALRTERGVDLVLVEGGPSLNHSLISSSLADELFITISPKLLGGTSNETLTILDGPAAAPIDVKLLSAHLADSELFLRYTLP